LHTSKNNRFLICFGHETARFAGEIYAMKSLEKYHAIVGRDLTISLQKIRPVLRTGLINENGLENPN